MTSESDAPAARWLVRIYEGFEELAGEIIHGLGATPEGRPGGEYHQIRLPDPRRLQQLPQALYLRWNLPLEHVWPCHPEKMPGFIEKAAQALARKFAPRQPQALWVGPLDATPARGYYKTLASNLRGRALQLFPPEVAAVTVAEAQDPQRESLFCLLGPRGLFCGMQAPALAGGFHAGGTKFLPAGAGTISRAGAKLAEALHFLKLHRTPPPAGAHWLELGASPGGMTSELLDRGYRVTAIDRAPLDRRLDHVAGLRAIRQDVADFEPAARHDAILCDMNGDPQAAFRQVARLARTLMPGGLVIFTLKTTGTAGIAETSDLLEKILAAAAAAGLAQFAGTHLTYNRHEFTLFFERLTAG